MRPLAIVTSKSPCVLLVPSSCSRVVGSAASCVMSPFRFAVTVWLAAAVLVSAASSVPLAMVNASEPSITTASGANVPPSRSTVVSTAPSPRKVAVSPASSGTSPVLQLRGVP